MVSSLISKKAQKLCLLVIILILFNIATSFAVENGRPIDKQFSGIFFRDGLLKVSVEKQKFRDIIGEVAIKAGVEIINDYPYEENVSISFNYLPLEEGLRRILKEKNYAFKYKTDEGNNSKYATSLMKVFIFSKLESDTVTMYRELGNNCESDNTEHTMTINEMQNQIREKLDEILVLQNFPQSNENIEEQYRQAMDDLKKTGIFEKKTEFKDAAGIEEKIKSMLQKIQAKEK
jgi:hypothetical protein